MTDSLSVLRDKRKVREWERRVLDEALATSLEFKPYRGGVHERDRTPMQPTEEQPYPSEILFCQGGKDNWAAPVIRTLPDGSREIAWPKDEFYFSRLAAVGVLGGMSEVVWRDVLDVFNATTDMLNNGIIDMIWRKSAAYGDDANVMFNALLHVYYGMVAEEHYQRVMPDGGNQRTRCGKLMKIHGLHRYLREHVDLATAAAECCSMNPAIVIERCREWGYVRDVDAYKDTYKTYWDDPTRVPVSSNLGKKGVSY